MKQGVQKFLRKNANADCKSINTGGQTIRYTPNNIFTFVLFYLSINVKIVLRFQHNLKKKILELLHTIVIEPLCLVESYTLDAAVR